MIIKLNITGMTPIRLELASELTQQLHVSRKKDKYDRRVTTSWITGTTTVTLERYHSNKNSKDVDGLIYVGRSFQQYMDKFDENFGFRLAGARALAKFFVTNGKTLDVATKLAEQAMDVIVANKGKEYVTIDNFAIKSAQKPVVEAKAVKAIPAKKRGRKAAAEKAEVKAVAAPARKRGRPSKAEKASAASVAAPARKRGRPRKQPV